MKYSNRGFRGARRHSCGKILRVLKKQGALMNIRQAVLFSCVILIAIFATLVVWPRAALTQQGATPQKQQTPTLDEYQPKTTLVTKEHKIDRGKRPFIDIHSHHWNPSAAEVDRLAQEKDTTKQRK